MADVMRPASFLPAIKCSDCGQEIEISMMGDHVCGGRQEASKPSVDTTHLRKVKNPFLAPSQARDRLYSKLDKITPPRIDPSAANRPFIGRGQTTPSSGSSNYLRSHSPSTPRERAQSPRPVARSTTSPLPRGYSPPSPDLVSPNLDCAFPPFPTSRSGTPDSTSNGAFRSQAGTRNVYGEPDLFYTPIDTKSKKSSNDLQRLNTTPSAPFTRHSKGDWPDSKSQKSIIAPRHRRTATENSVRESLRSNSSEKKGQGQPPSISASNQIYNSQPSINDTRDAVLSPNDDFSSSAKKRPPRPARPTENVDWFLHDLKEKDTIPAGQQLNQETRSRTFPLRKDSEDDIDGVSSSMARNPSRPSSRTRRPSLPSNPKVGPPLANHSRNRSFGRSGIRSDIQDTNAPPVPPTPSMRQPPRAYPGNHRRAESSSSSGSDGRRDGSKSTPPTSASSSMSSTASSTELFKKSNTLPPRPSTSQGRTGQFPKPTTGSQQFQSLNAFAGSAASSSSINRPNAPRSMGILDRGPVPDGPESPLDPAIQRGLFRSPPFSEPPQSMPQTATAPVLSKPLPPEPRPRSGPPTTKSRPTTKGNCRGCGELIVGKSIKAADGRLSGRYHKQCFVCQTCKSPFATTSFYVIADQPYCEQHYHTLNDSLCHACDRGVEGQYLETEAQQKFHPKCFTCSQCRVVLSRDYFEVGNGVFCERHAFGQTPGPGGFLGVGMGAGRRNPERRTTRLMMM